MSELNVEGEIVVEWLAVVSAVLYLPDVEVKFNHLKNKGGKGHFNT